MGANTKYERKLGWFNKVIANKLQELEEEFKT